MPASFIEKILWKANYVWLGWPRRVECNICRWGGRGMISDSWHPSTMCPKCGSTVRHRLLFAALGDLLAGMSILHFAPEAVLSDVLSSKGEKYVTADRFRTDVDLRIDISDMKQIADQTFDVVIACDVLEHVADDARAMDEIYRVLGPGGLAIITVPQKEGLKTTYENESIKTDEERLHAYGQADYLRLYGDDFSARLQDHCFQVTGKDEHSFPREIARKHVLVQPVMSSHPLATNYRRIYFARKAK